MELLKQLINRLLDNKIGFVVEHEDNIINISFDFRSEYDIETLSINLSTQQIIGMNDKKIPIGFCSTMQELQEFSPFSECYHHQYQEAIHRPTNTIAYEVCIICGRIK